MKLSYCEVFSAFFPDDQACLGYLHQLKSTRAFACLRCGHGCYSKGRTRFHRRCKSCGYDESPLAATLFAGIRLPVRKAFYLLYKLRTQRRESSAARLAQLFGLHPRTVLRFKKRLAGRGASAMPPPISQNEALSFLQGILLCEAQ